MPIPFALVIPFVTRNWQVFVIGAIFSGLLIYHGCAVRTAHQEGKQEGKQEVKEEDALSHDQTVVADAAEEARKKKLWDARESSIENQSLAVQDAVKQFLKMQTDYHMTMRRDSQAFQRNLQNAGRQAADVSDADLIPYWDALLAEHDRLDIVHAGTHPEDGSDT